MRKKRDRLVYILVIGDTLLMYLSIFLSLLIRYGNLSFLGTDTFRNHILFFSLIQLLWIVFLFLLDFYEIPPIKDAPKYFSLLITFMLLVFATGGLYFYLIPAAMITPKTILAIYAIILPLLLTLYRTIFRYVLTRGEFAENVVLICNQIELASLDKEVLENNHYSLQQAFSVNDYCESPKGKEYLDNNAPDFIVLGNDFYLDRELTGNIFDFLPLGLDYVSFSDIFERLYRKAPIEGVNEMWLLKNLCGKLGLADFSKRAFDLFFSSAGLLITIIIVVPITLLIKLTSPGPLIYRQERVGGHGEVFTLYKFRTMYNDAEANGPQWSDKDDPRVTGIGKFLRATHIDEFPQFYNIFKGELSFVGPRPERPEFVEMLKEQIPYYTLRHTVKPGLTGWAQINYDYGSSIADAKEKLQYDIYYITHQSFILDVGIILKTVRHLV